MNIVVCVKQVPDVDDIKWTKENNLDRTQMLCKLNTADVWALDWALQIKNRYKEATLCAVSMGPSQSSEILEYALAKGATRAILLSDKAFSGSDTYATAKILSTAIEKYVPEYNIIITGQKADDGDTEQVPVSLAQKLDIVDITNIVEIHSADKNVAFVTQKLDNVINMYETATPCLLAVKSPCPSSYRPKIEDYIRAQDTAIETYNLQDLGFEKADVGIIGSPTMVNDAYRPQNNKKAVEITEEYSDRILDLVFKVK